MILEETIMKILFNSAINDWYWQIYDETKRNHNIIFPDYYKDSSTKNSLVNLAALKKCERKNPDSDLIFDFRGYLPRLVKWIEKKFNIPMIVFAVNSINKPFVRKTSLFTNVWYVEKLDKLYIELYNKNQFIY